MCILRFVCANFLLVAAFSKASLYLRSSAYNSSSQKFRALYFVIVKHFLRVDGQIDLYRLFLFLWPVLKMQSSFFWSPQVFLGSILFILSSPLSNPPPSLSRTAAAFWVHSVAFTPFRELLHRGTFFFSFFYSQRGQKIWALSEMPFFEWAAL